MYFIFGQPLKRKYQVKFKSACLILLVSLGILNATPKKTTLSNRGGWFNHSTFIRSLTPIYLGYIWLNRPCVAKRIGHPSHDITKNEWR